MNKTLYLLLVALMLSLQMKSAFANTHNDDLLKEANELRTSEPQKSIQLLQQISINDLNPEQHSYFQYLSAYSQLMAGNTKHGVELLEILLEETQSSVIRARTLSSLLNNYASLHLWDKAFQTHQRLRSILPTLKISQIQDQANLVLLSFYNNIEAFDSVIVTADNLLNRDISQRTRCLTLEKKLYAQTKLPDPQLTVSDFIKAIDFCEQINEQILKQAVISELGEFYNDHKRCNDTAELLITNIDELKTLNFPVMTAYSINVLLIALINKQDWHRAEVYANDIINNYSQEDYYVPYKTAYQALFEMYRAQGNYVKALDNHIKFKELEKRVYDDNVSRQMGIEQARLKRDTTLQLLSQENRLLATRSQLQQTQNKVKTQWLIVTIALLAIAFAWLFRNRITHKKLRTIAQMDGLTGIYNRSYFTQSAVSGLSYCEKTSQSVSFIIFDLDHFKQVNDKFGHLIGDWALIEAVKAVKQVCRANDIVGRMGGEEFAILLPNCDKAKAVEIAEACRQQIEAIDTDKSGHFFTLTASFGISCSDESGYLFDRLFAAADGALYQSKSLGRNRVYSHNIEQLSIPSINKH